MFYGFYVRGRRISKIEPLPGLLFTVTAAALRFDVGAHQAQAQSEAARGAALVAAVEAIENARQILLRNAAAGIGHADHDRIRLGRLPTDRRGRRAACT